MSERPALLVWLIVELEELAQRSQIEMGLFRITQLARPLERRVQKLGDDPSAEMIDFVALILMANRKSRRVWKMSARQIVPPRSPREM